MLACLNFYEDVVEALLAHGADPSIEDDNRRNALEIFISQHLADSALSCEHCTFDYHL